MTSQTSSSRSSAHRLIFHHSYLNSSVRSSVGRWITAVKMGENLTSVCQWYLNCSFYILGRATFCVFDVVTSDEIVQQNTVTVDSERIRRPRERDYLKTI